MATMVKGCCMVCKKEWEKNLGHINRAIRVGYDLFCGQKCAAIRKRTSIEDKKAVKAEYDKALRLTEAHKLKKAEQFKKDYAANPEKYREITKKKYPKHLQYLQSPEYRAWKKNYDEKYHAENKYGEFGEAWILLKQLEGLLDKQQLRIDKDCHNKKKKRTKLCRNQQSLPPLLR